MNQMQDYNLSNGDIAKIWKLKKYADEHRINIRTKISDPFFWRYFPEVNFIHDKENWHLYARLGKHLPPEVNGGLMDTAKFDMYEKDGNWWLHWTGQTPENVEHWQLELNHQSERKQGNS